MHASAAQRVPGSLLHQRFPAFGGRVPMNSPFARAFERALREAQAAMNAGDFETAFAGLAPDVEWHFGEWLFDMQVIHGREGVIDFYRRLRDVGDWEVETHEVEEIDPSTFLVRQTGKATGRATRIVTERESFFVYELGDTGVKRLREFATRDEALAAAPH